MADNKMVNLNINVVKGLLFIYFYIKDLFCPKTPTLPISLSSCLLVVF